MLIYPLHRPGHPGRKHLRRDKGGDNGPQCQEQGFVQRPAGAIDRPWPRGMDVEHRRVRDNLEESR